MLIRLRYYSGTTSGIMQPIINTEKAKTLFYDMAEDALKIIEFKPKTYLNTYIYKDDTSIENIYNGMAGKKTNISWQDRTKIHNLKSGTLYEIYFDWQNSVMDDGDHLHTYAFVHKDLDRIGKDIYNELNAAFPTMGQTVWFSYMEADTYFSWHRDEVGYRYHHVLVNDGITPSYSTRTRSVYCKPGSAFVEYVNDEHMILPSVGPRLHMITSMRTYNV